MPKKGYTYITTNAEKQGIYDSAAFSSILDHRWIFQSYCPPKSQLPGGNVIKLRNWDSASEFIAAEQEIIRQHTPVYIYCEVPATALSTIHQLESTGCRFSEFRIRKIKPTCCL